MLNKNQIKDLNPNWFPECFYIFTQLEGMNASIADALEEGCTRFVIKQSVTYNHKMFW